jgi:hypothetical protein
MIMSLTNEQRARFPEFVKKWVAIGLSTKPADRDRAERAIAGLYRLAKLKEPRVIWLPCPISAALSAVAYAHITAQRRIERKGAVHSAVGRAVHSAVATAVRSAVHSAVDSAVGSAVHSAVGSAVGSAVDSAVGSAVGSAVDSAGHAYFGGSLWCWYSAWADYFNEVCAVAIDRNYLETQESCGFYWTLDDVCFASERPAEINRDQAGRLHCETGMSISYSGTGWGLYSWHGYTIPPTHHWVIADKVRLNADAIEKEPNAELRRIMLEIYGFERFLSDRKAKVVAEDVDGNGHSRRLLTAKVKGETIRMIEVNNGSLEPDGARRKFVLGAMPGKTPHECIAASYGIKPHLYREAVRT